MTNQGVPTLYTTREAASILRTSEEMVCREIRRRNLRASKRRGRWFTTPEWIQEYLEDGEPRRS